MTAGPEALPEPPRRERRVVPVVGVVVVLLAVLLGGYVVAAALSEPAGSPIVVGGAVRLAPLSGWELASRRGDPPSVTLTRGSGSLDVAAFPFVGSARGLLEGYVTGAIEPAADHLSVSSIQPVRLASGIRGASVRYVGTFGDVQAPIEGEVTAVIYRSGVGVVFDGSAPSGLLRYVLEDVDTMISRATIS